MSLIKFGVTQQLKRLTGWEPVVINDKAYDIVIGSTDYETAVKYAPQLIPGATIANPTTEEQFNALLALQKERDNEGFEFWVGVDDDGDGIVKHLCSEENPHGGYDIPINSPDPLSGFCIEYPVNIPIPQDVTSNFITLDNRVIVTKDRKVFTAKNKA